MTLDHVVLGPRADVTIQFVSAREPEDVAQGAKARDLKNPSIVEECPLKTNHSEQTATNPFDLSHSHLLYYEIFHPLQVKICKNMRVPLQIEGFPS